MSTANRYSPEVRERAVRLVFEYRDEYHSEWAAIRSIADKFGCSTVTLRNPSADSRYPHWCNHQLNWHLILASKVKSLHYFQGEPDPRRASIGRPVGSSASGPHLDAASAPASIPIVIPEANGVPAPGYPGPNILPATFPQA